MSEIKIDKLYLEFPLSGVKGGLSFQANSSSSGNITSNGKTNVVRAIDNLTVQFKQSERIGIIGSNGSGKSSLLRVLAGIYSPTAGIVKVEGSVNTLLNVGLGVRLNSTGRRNIHLRAMLNGLSRREIKTHEREIIEFSELGPFIDLPMRMYSAGMQLRLSFAMATSFEPEILLMDEWIGVGDRNFQDKAVRRLNSLVSDSGISIICSHNLNIINRTCDRVLWLNSGKLQADGPPQNVLYEFDKFRSHVSK